LTSLSTLRRMGRPIATQDSLSARGPPEAESSSTRRDLHPQGFNERFQSASLILLSMAFPDARTPYLIQQLTNISMVSPETPNKSTRR
jgi:hypothetical protein